jgi:ABC-type nickel/cobalt efflux system permease component RcnA
MTPGLIAAVIGIGLVHGVLPDHGWPIAAMYALRRRYRLTAGTIAALVIGLGHLLSSIALVGLFLVSREALGWQESGWLPRVAGGLLIGLGCWEAYQARAGHTHDSEQAASTAGPLGRLWRSLERALGTPAERGLGQLALVAILLGIAHEEPIQILAICAGTSNCLGLMVIYSLAVIVALWVPTLLLILGFERHRERIEHWMPHLSLLTAAVLVGVGVWFILRA